MVPLRTVTLTVALGLLACSLALVPAASADSNCTGVLVGGKFTGTCPNDPACPSPDSVASGFYVQGKRVACV